MSLKLVSMFHVPITLELALKFRDMEPIKNERDLKPARAQEQLTWLQTGKAFSMLWGLCRYQGVDKRGNGNHTSNLITACFQAHGSGLDKKAQAYFNTCFKTKRKGAISSPKELPEIAEGSLTAFVEEFTADNEDDLLTCFLRYDSKVSVRPPSEVMAIQIGRHDDLGGLEKKKIHRCLGGVVRAALDAPELYGFLDKASVKAEAFSGLTGSILKCERVRQCVRWIIETVPNENLYDKVAGSQVFAELWAGKGEEVGSLVVNELMAKLERDEEPVASWESLLNRTRNKPTVESLVKKGRTVIQSITRGLKHQV